MRAMFMVGVVVVLCGGLSGCASSQATAEKLNQDIIDGLNKLCDGLEHGDKDGVKSSLARLNELARTGKDVKVTKATMKAIEAKFKPQMDVTNKRLQEALMKAMTNEKFTDDEIKEIQTKLLSFAKDMEGAGT